jgi:sugar O-acyltransferase (sialic acid O-acetyltransferase NeuD family)
MDNKKWHGLPMVIFGVKGHACEVKTIINNINTLHPVNMFNILGFVSNCEEHMGKIIHDNSSIIASDSNFIEFARDYPVLGVTLGISRPHIKSALWNKLLCKIDNLVYPNIISPQANIGDFHTHNFGMGIIIAAGTTLTTNIKLDNFININVNCSIGHFTSIGKFCAINPLTAIAGDVKIGDNVTLGSGSSVRENITIGNNVMIGTGAAVVKNIPDGQTVVGVPANQLIK